MKRHRPVLFGLALLLLAGICVTCVLAQRIALQDPLVAALELYDLGELDAARTILAGIEPSDPNYDLALAYEALCRYEVCCLDGGKDYQWFLNGLKRPALTVAVLPPELSEELAYKEIDALYRNGHFIHPKPLILIRAAAFQEVYPASARLMAVDEYRLATQFERGMHQVYEASMAEADRWQRPWTNGLAHLEQFMTAAAGWQTYQVLAERSLDEDLAVALAVLAGEPEALGRIITPADPFQRERLGVLRVGLHRKLHPEQRQQNLQLLAQFLEELGEIPASEGRMRTLCDLGRLGMRAGEALYLEAREDAWQGRAALAEEKRAAGSEYYQVGRTLQEVVRVDKEAGVKPSEVHWLLVGRVTSYWWERKDAQVAAEAGALVADSEPGSWKWLLGRLYTGMLLRRQFPDRLEEPAGIFEEVMAFGFRNRMETDALVLAAARWRMGVAMTAEDFAKTAELYRWVEGSNCQPGLKAKFRKNYAPMAGWLAAQGYL